MILEMHVDPVYGKRLCLGNEATRVRAPCFLAGLTYGQVLAAKITAIVRSNGGASVLTISISPWFLSNGSDVFVHRVIRGPGPGRYWLI